MKTNRLLWIVIVAFAVLFLPYEGGAHIRSDKRIKIAEDTCFYMASGGRYPSLPSDSSKVKNHFYDMGMQFMLVDDNGNVIRKTPFVFSFISRSYDGFNVEIIEPVIFHKDTTTLDLVFLHLDSNFNLKFIYPANCIARSPYGAKGISYILNHGFWGAVDSLGHYIYEPEYDEIVNIDHNSDELDALKIKYGKNNEDNIRMRVFRSEYEKNSYEHYDLYMPADCLPYVIHPGNLGQFFDEADELMALEYLQGKYGTSQKFNELYQFHHGIFCTITHKRLTQKVSFFVYKDRI